jgi:hypothetical protein
MIITERTGLSVEEGVGNFAENVWCQYKTAVALTDGDCVRISAITTIESKYQVTITNVATTASDHLFLGTYDGTKPGGSGALNTTTGGKNALANDIVYVIAYGIANARVEGTSAIAANDSLTMSTTDGAMIIAAAAASCTIGVHYNAVALEAWSTASVTYKKIFVRAL